MDLSDYQKAASETAVYPNKCGLEYCIFGLSSEVGEVCAVVKRVMRDNGGTWTPEALRELDAELGDVLWYVSQVAREANLTLAGLARRNLRKLRDRASRGRLHGKGGDR